MTSQSVVLVSLLLAANTAAAFAAEPTSEPSTQELLNQIKQLQTKVEQLEARQNQTSADVAATVDKIVKDAEARSKLMADVGGISGNWHEGQFILASDDNRFVLKPGAFFQFRNTSNYNTAGDDSLENGFEIRRFKMYVEGNLFEPDLTYKVQYATGTSTGSPRLEDIWAKYRFQPNWSIRGGQFVNPVVHEQLVSSTRQLAAERSLLDNVISGETENYVQGVTLIYDDSGPLRAEFGFTDGISSQDTTFRDFPANSTDWGAAGRVEWFAVGKDRKQYSSLSGLGAKEDQLVLGAAGDITQAGSDTQYLHTVDAQWSSPNGFSAYLAYLARFIDTSAGDAYDWGILAQAGYMFQPKWEGFVRYDFVKLDGGVAFPTGGSEDTFHEFTLGVNYFLHGHAVKFTVDASYLPSGCPSDQVGLGALGGDDAQFLLRAQFQLAL